MKLIDTVELMNSDDYKERFIAEYYQTKIRYDKLHKMLVRYEAQKLNFEPSSPIYLLEEQVEHMGNYLRVLEIRAEIENIDLEWNKAKMEIKISSGNNGPFEDMDELVEKFSKDLEEMLNDIAEKRES